MKMLWTRGSLSIPRFLVRYQGQAVKSFTFLTDNLSKLENGDITWNKMKKPKKEKENLYWPSSDLMWHHLVCFTMATQST